MSEVTKWQFGKIKTQDTEGKLVFSPISGTIDCEATWCSTENYNESYKQIEKEILKIMENNNEFTFIGCTLGANSTYIQDENSFDLLKPERIIYNKRTTICKWKDGTKTVVKATKDDNATHEHGVAMCIMRKLFESRQEFLRLVDGGYDVIEESKKRAIAEVERKRKYQKEQERIEELKFVRSGE